MKAHIQFKLWLLIILFITSCKKKDQNKSYDNEVYSQITQEIIDSCVIIPPPPPNPKIGEKAIIDYKKIISDYYDKERIIAVYDTIYGYKQSPFEKLNKENNFNINWNSSDSINHIINVSNINVKENIKLIEARKLPSLYKFVSEFKSWEDYNELKKIDVALSFNRVIFYDNKSRGFLQIGIICGKLCGQGYDIWIKKEKNKWKITKLKPTWIS